MGEGEGGPNPPRPGPPRLLGSDHAALARHESRLLPLNRKRIRHSELPWVGHRHRIAWLLNDSEHPQALLVPSTG
jgi:hypothetical protein